MFDALDFVYLPSRDVAVDLKHFTDQLGAELVFAIEAFGTRVAMVRLAADPPPLLFAGHLQGDQAILVYRVESYDQAVRELERRGVGALHRLEIPHGPCASFTAAGGQRIAVYELVRPGAAAHFDGRIDEPSGEDG